MVERDSLSARVIGAAIEVHRVLGPGLLESVYSKCLRIELDALGLRTQREVSVPIRYRGTRVDAAYRIDLLIEKTLIVEVKSTARDDPVFRAQLLTYLKLTGLRTGLLLNFGRPTLREGIIRMVR